MRDIEVIVEGEHIECKEGTELLVWHSGIRENIRMILCLPW